MFIGSRNFNSIAIAIVIFFVFASICQAQVTFSRDWNPGKRTTVDAADFRATMKSANALCHILTNQIRQLATCDNHIEDVDAGAVSVFPRR